jgi:hypothetical protein
MTACSSGTCQYNGLNITGGTTTGVTSYGLYVDAGTGTGTNYAAQFVGKVSIGTESLEPMALLEIKSTGTEATDDLGEVSSYHLMIRSGTAATGKGPGIAFANGLGDNVGASIVFIRNGSNNVGSLEFYTKQTTGLSDDPIVALRITQTGLIQLNLDGASSSTEAVCHSGTDAAVTMVTLIDCSGTPVADYAEMYPTQASSEYGDILAVSSQYAYEYEVDGKGKIQYNQPKRRLAKLTKATSAYQANTIGVASNNYGDFSSTGHNRIDEADHPLPVALSGRVPVKVTSANGAIHAGDYITTSFIPGAGMKATEAGMVIGKALADYDNSDPSAIGTVLVFVDNMYYQPGVNLATNPDVEDASTDSQADNPIANINSELATNLAAIPEVTLQQLTVQGALVVGGPAEFRGPAIFKGIAEFFNNVIFHNNATFEGQTEFATSPTFNNDTAGTAIIRLGQRQVRIDFTQAFITAPVVSTTLNSGPLLNDSYQAYLNANLCTPEEGLEGCEQKLKAKLLSADVHFVLTNQSATGFTIELAEPAEQDIQFNWTAVQVKDQRQVISPTDQ